MLLIYLRMSKEEYGLVAHDGIAQVVRTRQYWWKKIMMPSR